MEKFIILMIIAATPLLLAAIGELVAERSGVLNLGIEGMMLMGAVIAFAVANSTGSSSLAIIAGAGAGAAMALIFSVVALSLLANQPATGLALTIFGIGASGLIGQGFVGIALEPLAKLSIPVLSESTSLGRIVLSHDAKVYMALALAAGVAWFLYNTRGGLALRAVGDNHDSGHALGYNVIAIRYMATMFGGACAGLGGAYLSVVDFQGPASSLPLGTVRPRVSAWVAACQFHPRNFRLAQRSFCSENPNALVTKDTPRP